MARDWQDAPSYSLRDVSNVANKWADACRRDFRRGLFWGAFAMAILVTVCRAFGWL